MFKNIQRFLNSCTDVSAITHRLVLCVKQRLYGKELIRIYKECYAFSG